ncbi:hypothetical protein BH11ARM2_BH11ARM2_25450 [soil metagenome]
MRRALLLSPLFLLGCHGPAAKLTKAAPAALPQGWTLVESAQDGVSIGAPPGWRQGVPKMFDVTGMLGDSGSDPNASPDAQRFADELKQQDQQDENKRLEKLRSEGILCHCVNGARPTIGEEPTRFYVTVEKPGGSLTLKEASDMEKEHLLEGGAGKDVTLANGKAWRFESRTKTRGGDDLLKISYVLAHDDRKYTLHFVSTNDPVSIEGIERPVAESLRIDPGATPVYKSK